MIMMRFIPTLLFLLTLVSCRGRRGDQDQPEEEEQDFLIGFGNEVEDNLDENIQEMTLENTQIVASERINEEEVDDELATAEKQVSYPVWKILLVVAGGALGLVLLIGAVILVIKSRNNVKEDEMSSKGNDKEEDREATAISCLGKKIQVKDEKKERKTLIDQIRFSLAENIPV